jgi:hypothetical protein
MTSYQFLGPVLSPACMNATTDRPKRIGLARVSSLSTWSGRCEPCVTDPALATSGSSRITGPGRRSSLGSRLSARSCAGTASSASGQSATRDDRRRSHRDDQPERLRVETTPLSAALATSSRRGRCENASRSRVARIRKRARGTNGRGSLSASHSGGRPPVRLGEPPAPHDGFTRPAAGTRIRRRAIPRDRGDHGHGDVRIGPSVRRSAC